MRTTIKKWGNSLAICIPHELADEIGLEVGSEVELRVVNGELGSESDEENVTTLMRC